MNLALAAGPDFPAKQTLFTLRQFVQAEPAWTESAMRNLIFKSGRKLEKAGALIRQGRKILIHRQRFLMALDAQA